MNKVKQFMNKITEKGVQGSTDLSSGVVQPDETEEQLSAEGFLCPDCMRAFPSPESLAEHYTSNHGAAGTNYLSPSDSNDELDTTLAQEQLLELRLTLEQDERQHSADMQREVKLLRSELESRKSSVSSSKSQEGLHEGSSNTQKQDEQIPQLMEQLKRLTKDNRERTIETDQLKSEVTRMQELLNTANRQGSELSENMRKQHEEELANLTKEASDWQSKFLEAQKELSNCKKATAKAAEKHQESFTLLKQNLESQIEFQLQEINSLKENLSISQNTTKVTEDQCQQLNQEVSRLRDQHFELVGRIEGDEATQAAIESLNKERDALKDNLECSQTQNRELAKNLHNIGLELEKSQNESKATNTKLDETRKKMEDEGALYIKRLEEKDRIIEQQEKKCSEVTLLRNTLKTQLTEESAELLRIQTLLKDKEEKLVASEKTSACNVEQISKLKKELESTAVELKSTKRHLSEVEAVVATLNQTVQKKSDEIEKLNNELKELRSINGSLQASFHSQKLESDTQLQKFEKDYESLSKEYQLFKEQASSAESNFSEKITMLTSQLEKGKKFWNENQEKMSSDLLKIKQELNDVTKNRDELMKELDSQKDSAAADRTNLKKDLEETQTQLEEKKKLLKDFANQVDILNEELAALRQRATRFQEEQDSFLASKLELEKKYKSSEEARALLLDRCLLGESETEKFQETIQGLQRKLADSLAALQELGRENQSLQVESAKLQGRKWADDSMTTNCYTCTKEFSITLRKHHCRACGNIFCHGCSSRTASIPSSKKPERVCDPCYEELLAK